MALARPVVYDVTPLARRSIADVGGIDRVALAYARHFAATSQPAVWAAYFGARAPHLLAAGALDAILRNTEAAWRDDIAAGADPALAAILSWLELPSPAPPADPAAVSRFFRHSPTARAQRIAFHVRNWLAGALRPPPRDAIYLNVFNAGREHHFLFDWLKRRPDVRAAFFVHDLLPLDRPEFFPHRYVELTERRLVTIARHGTAFITSTNVVRDRLLEELRKRGRSDPPVHVAPLPSLLIAASPPAFAKAALAPYFLVVGTIEPRKNHLLLLDLWCEFASRGENVPRLLALGAPGWKNDEALSRFAHSNSIRRHVLNVGRVSAAALAQLIANAQALLMPSFDEGYGLPVVEALTVGTPVIASDIPVFREISQGCATLLPLNAGHWRDAILAFADPQSSTRHLATAKAARFRAPTWPHYFQSLEVFLDGL
jgi:glycosyltransferase involved in cell wall biosynthesis